MISNVLRAYYSIVLALCELLIVFFYILGLLYCIHAAVFILILVTVSYDNVCRYRMILSVSYDAVFIVYDTVRIVYDTVCIVNDTVRVCIE